MKKFCFIFLLMISSDFLFAQYEGEIVGKVMDSLSREPLFGAGISLEQNGVSISQTLTDENGAFYFKPVKPGDYELKTSFLGYIDGDYLLDVRSNSSTFIKVEVNKDSKEMPEFVYRAPKDTRNIINEIPIIKAKDFEHMGADSPTKAVSQSVAQVYNQDGGDKGGIFIAGSRADATLYVIDGVKVEGSSYLPKSAIAEITVYTSGIPAKYGDVTGGVIEIRTKSYDKIY